MKTIILLLLCFNLTAQINPNIIQASSLQFTSGLLSGTREAIQFRGLGQGHKFFDPKLSWVNKWELDADGSPIVGTERFKGSSTLFVGFTDYYHMSGQVSTILDFGTLIPYAKGWKKKNWKWVVVDMAIMGASRALGSYIGYEVIPKI